ncbi:MAG TPA: Gldg family protein [Vicinamibacterales bacterium]|nr:Gldg family protein [Vicinamibacterales bacterium]
MLRRILGLLGWLGVALVFAAVAMRFLKPELPQWHNGLAIAGLVCTLLYILSQWREVVRSFSGREARYGSLAVASIAVVLAILVGINYLANRRNKRWDLTAAKQFTLSEQTKKVLQGLDKPVVVRVFDRSENFDRFRQRLDEYRYVSDRITVEYIDVDRRPALANQYQVQMTGTVVFEYDGRTERVTSDGEQELTNGLIKVVQGTQHKVYFVQGHGEKSITGGDRASYSTIVSALQSDNFAHDTLVLAQQKEVPADATVLIVAGPTADFLEPEIEMLRAYMARGGKLFLLLDPPDKPGAPDLTNLIAFAAEWGINVGTNVVVDASGIGQVLGTGPEVPIAAKYNPHPITDRFNLLTAYSLARTVTANPEGANNRFAQNLVETSPSSWAESNIKELMTSGRVARETEQGDLAGPVSLAAAVSAPAEQAPAGAENPEANAETRKPEARLVVMGDSDFASNRWLGISGNRDLFMNAVNWLAQQENMIAIRPKDPEDRRITLTADQDRRIFWITVLIIPGLILAAGVHTWWRRR